jgi:hypothetical protein
MAVGAFDEGRPLKRNGMWYQRRAHDRVVFVEQNACDEVEMPAVQIANRG